MEASADREILYEVFRILNGLEHLNHFINCCIPEIIFNPMCVGNLSYFICGKYYRLLLVELRTVSYTIVTLLTVTSLSPQNN